MEKKQNNKKITLTSVEMKVNLNQLQKNVKKAYGSMMKLLPKAIITEREITPFGNASHVILPKEYTKKKATIIIN